MNTQNKNEIKLLLDAFVARHESQKKAVQLLRDVSEAIVINVRKGKWESISDEMWRRIATQVGYNVAGTWRIVPTQPLLTLTALFDDARMFQNTLAIVSPAGSGKTAAAKSFSTSNRNVFHIQCSEYLNRKAFLAKIIEAMGVAVSGSVSFMMDAIVDHVSKLETPLFIFDEADKLSDQVLYFFISLYNQLQDKCGIVLLSTDYLSTRIQRGRKLNKKGYNEIFSRIGRRFINVNPIQKNDVLTICQENGVSDPIEIDRIFNSFEGDLRRVEREVHKFKRLSQTKTAA